MCEFRPCIDLHAGVVKQIVGSTLGESGEVSTNFVSSKSASDYATLYKQDGLLGGHVIMLGHTEKNKRAAKEALSAYPGGLQVGGGLNPENCKEFLTAGASQVIVTSYIFNGNTLDFTKLQLMSETVGKDKLVIDLSCRKKNDDGPYFVCTNRWQTFTDFEVNKDSLEKLSTYCSEFLVHGVEVEGLRCGILEDLVELLSQSPIPVTYAGGIRDLADLNLIKKIGKNRVHATIGSALDIFGGSFKYSQIIKWHAENKNQ